MESPVVSASEAARFLGVSIHTSNTLAAHPMVSVVRDLSDTLLGQYLMGCPLGLCLWLESPATPLRTTRRSSLHCRKQAVFRTVGLRPDHSGWGVRRGSIQS